MKVFKTEEEMKKYGEKFGKYQFETVELNGKKKILCGTDMVYEEKIWGDVETLVDTMVQKFVPTGEKGKYDLTSLVAGIRDEIIERFEEEFGIEFVDVCDEY